MRIHANLQYALRRCIALLVFAAAVVIATPSIAGSGEILDLDVDLISPAEPLAFRYRFPSGTCEQGAFDVTVEANGSEVVTLPAHQSAVDSDVFTFALPSDTRGGEFVVDAECHDGETLFTGHGEKEWGALTVTKIVTGSQPPDDSLFNVIADCRGDVAPATPERRADRPISSSTSRTRRRGVCTMCIRTIPSPAR